MIDADQLRTLGWEESLIAELSKQAVAIERSAVASPLPVFHATYSSSGSVVFIGPDARPNAASTFLAVRQGNAV